MSIAPATYSLLSASHAGAIVGMPTAEARILLRDLTEHATQPQFVHVHRWRPWLAGDTPTVAQQA